MSKPGRIEFAEQKYQSMSLKFTGSMEVSDVRGPGAKQSLQSPMSSHANFGTRNKMGLKEDNCRVETQFEQGTVSNTYVCIRKQRNIQARTKIAPKEIERFGQDRLMSFLESNQDEMEHSPDGQTWDFGTRGYS